MQRIDNNKTKSIARNELTFNAIGLLRLNEIGVLPLHFSTDEIDHIGKCSLYRHTVVLGKIATKLGDVWAIEGHAKDNGKFRPYYVIKGKRVYSIYGRKLRNTTKTTAQLVSEFNAHNKQKCLSEMSTEEIFAEGKQVSKKHHKVRISARTQIEGCLKHQTMK